MKIAGIIPARYASTRFPAKALVDIQGKSMIRRVYEQAKKAQTLDDVIIATDHTLIFDHVTSWGGNVVMTSSDHPSGTDRCQEVISTTNAKFDFVINIQGDEPFIKPEQIDLLSSCLSSKTELATLAIKIKKTEDLFNPNMPKVIFDKDMRAIYFSRNPMPYVRGKEQAEWLSQYNFYRHIGIYAYRTDILSKITLLSPSGLEIAESLEQLRWIENGFAITVQITEHESHGIDTPEDLKIALASNSLH